jgi:hypothetical protein
MIAKPSKNLHHLLTVSLMNRLFEVVSSKDMTKQTLKERYSSEETITHPYVIFVLPYLIRLNLRDDWADSQK